MSTKTIQGKLWSIAPQNWSIHFEPYFMPIYREVLKKVNIDENTMLLDAGCGSGLFVSIADSTGAQVTGVDAASGLLDVARERNPGVTFLEEDLESLPFADNTFDVVTGFNSFQYAGNFENAVKEAKRVLKPGGKLVAVIWDKPEMSEGTEILKAISTLLPPPAAGTPGPFALSENGKVEAVLDSIGLTNVSKTKVPCPFLYHGLTNAISSFMGTGPAAGALNQNPKAVVEAVIADAFEKFHLADDMYFIMNSFLLFVAEK